VLIVECPSLSWTILGCTPDWRPVVKQARGCLASAWARIAAKAGEVEATHFRENEWSEKIPAEVIEASLLQKARFAHMS
jgi:acyl carrier protein phosphodiesterase